MTMTDDKGTSSEGILLVDKPANRSSFSVVHAIRSKLKVKRVGHGGTLDPFATGLLVILVGRNYTKRADEFLLGDKEYTATVKLGARTDSFDCDGEVTHTSDYIPTINEVENVIKEMQGNIEQKPPMYSARKVNGKRLYKLARAGKTIELKSSIVNVTTTLLSYEYPNILIHVTCSKGTYIRALADTIGEKLTSYAHLSELRRTRSGRFALEEAKPLSTLMEECHNYLRCE